MEPDKKEKKVSKFKQLRSQIDPATQALWNDEQNHLKSKIVEQDTFDWTPEALRLIAGVDISFSQNYDDVACSALIVYDKHKKEVVYQDFEFVHLDLPYVPGFLAFRELPSLLELFKRLKQNKPDLWPQVVFVDGNGIIHPNQCGLACHLGILVDLPTIGCGKTFFYVDGLSKEGIYQACDEKLVNAGDYVVLRGKSGRLWAAAIKSSSTSNDPLFVSVGHKISLQTAVDCIVRTCKYRIPQPIRQADLRSRERVKTITEQEALSAKTYPMIYTKPKN